MKLSSSLSLNIIILILFLTVRTHRAADITPGSTLYASNLKQSWDSPSKNFSFSFIQESNSYFAAITYNGIPIWKAGDANGAVDSNAVLRFDSNGSLQLIAGDDSGSLIWESNTSGLGVTSASLEDSGNFILKKETSPIWTTFDHPTDTILPEQNFTVNHVLRCGSYYFRLSRSGEMSLRWNDSITYYTSYGINNTVRNLNLSSPHLAMQTVGIFSLFDPTLSSPIIMARDNIYGETSGNPLRFVKLDCDGNVRIYSSSSDSGKGNQVMRWTAVSDQCRVFGYCGNFGICRYDQNSFDPICICPSENFEKIDPSDARRGCKRKAELQGCQRSILTLNNSLFLTYDRELVSDYFTATINACRGNCLNSQPCLASTSLADGSGVCYMKSSAFISGYQSPTLTSTSYVIVCDPPLPNPPFGSTKDSNALKIAVIALGSALLLLVLPCFSLWLYNMSKPRYETLLSQYSLSDYASGVPLQFSYKELQQATKGFGEKLGEGGFGSVYRGTISNKLPVAVKRLESVGQGEKQFRMEVAAISSTHHLNLVRLVGFCSEGRHRLLVYEFMKNGSLDQFLFSDKKRDILNWTRRYGIALGMAKGFAYLHEECRDCILHCDIKPENVLLDENYGARISDFGLARLLGLNDQRHRSLITVRGTRGYLAPEWVSNRPLTAKADVYSFGLVLLELVSGKRNFEVSRETDQKKFSLWAYDEFEKGNLVKILDPRLVVAGDEVLEEAGRVVRVSFWCINEQVSSRPTMGRVVQMLEGIADVAEPPRPVAKVEGVLLKQHGTAVSSSSAQMAVFSSSSLG